MNDEMILMSAVFSIPVFWMFFKMSVHGEQQPPEPTHGPAASPSQKRLDDKAA